MQTKSKIKWLTSVILALTLCLSVLPATAFAAEGETAFRKLNVLDDVTDGSSCVIVAQTENAYYALGTTIAAKITGVEVDVTDGVVTADDLPVWTVEATETGYNLTNGTNYLAYGSSTSFKAADAAYEWNISSEESGVFHIIASTANTRGILLNSSNAFGAYAISNIGKTGYYGDLMIFKEYADSDEPTTIDITTLTPNAKYDDELTAETEITLSCNGLDVVYEVSSDGEVWTALEGNTYTVPTAEPGEYSLFFRACLDNEYSKTLELSYSIVVDDSPKAPLAETISDSDTVYIYNASSSTALTATVSGKKLAGAKAKVTDEGLSISDDILALTVSIDSDGYYSFITDDGLYLTSAETGNGLSLAEEASDYSLWTVEEAEGGYYIVNVNAIYGENNQYLEYYNGYTTYSFNAANPAIYTFQFFAPKNEEADDPIMGDVTGDGIINVRDATELQKILVGMHPATDVQKVVGDVDYDGRLTIRDVTEIQRYCVKVIDSFGPAPTPDPEPATYTLYFKTTLGWMTSDGVNLYAYDTATGKNYQLVKDENAYPNVFIAEVDSSVSDVIVYRYTEEASSTPVTGDNVYNAWSATVSSANNCITLANDESVSTGAYVEETKPVFALERVYFDNSDAAWSNVYIYGWAESGLDNQAVLMTNIEGTDIWYYDFSTALPVGANCFLFKNTENTWELQTANAIVDDGKNCYLAGKENNAEGTWTVYGE